MNHKRNCSINPGDSPTAKVPSPARQAAARVNGAKSKGPITARGKSISRRNAWKHGLRATTLLLDPALGGEHLRAVREAVLEEFQPRTLEESLVVEQLIMAICSRKRAFELELQTLDYATPYEARGVDRMIRHNSAVDKRFAEALAQWNEMRADAEPDEVAEQQDLEGEEIESFANFEEPSMEMPAMDEKFTPETGPDTSPQDIQAEDGLGTAHPAWVATEPDDCAPKVSDGNPVTNKGAAAEQAPGQSALDALPLPVPPDTEDLGTPELDS